MKKSEQFVLGIEGGGTKTIAIASSVDSKNATRIELGAANLRLSSDRELSTLFRGLKQRVGTPEAIGIGLPGVRTDADGRRVTKLLKDVWPKSPSRVTHDLDLVIHAAEADEVETKHLAKVVILCGTGSCCFGRSAAGATAKVGGWGHVLGDKGSGYDIALHACRAAVYYFDRDNEWTKLGESILRFLCLNEPNDLINWIQGANKKEIAAVAVAVFDAWAKGDRHAAEVIETAAHGLAADALKCAARLENSDAMVQFVLAGSVLLKQPRFAELVAETIRQKRSQSVIAPLRREAAWGAVELGRSLLDGSEGSASRFGALEKSEKLLTSIPTIVDLEKSPTEMRNPRSRNLDKLSARAAVDLFISEEKVVQAGLRKAAPKIERAVTMVAEALKRGGRIIYVGAGTSGRLGILDASECPPTFRTNPEMVQGIIAGGQPAIFRAVEGAEDDAAAGARAVEFRNVGKRDVVIGIAASGRTPFVWGALEAARKRSAKTVLLTFNPNFQIPIGPRLDLLLDFDVGPELLTGSTRLKSGTATKLILNMLTTLAMVRLGKVKSNLMIDLNPSNVKLRDRAIRIVQEVSGVSRESAEAALMKGGWVVKDAIEAIQPKSKRRLSQ